MRRGGQDGREKKGKGESRKYTLHCSPFDDVGRNGRK